MLNPEIGWSSFSTLVQAVSETVGIVIVRQLEHTIHSP